MISVSMSVNLCTGEGGGLISTEKMIPSGKYLLRAWYLMVLWNVLDLLSIS